MSGTATPNLPLANYADDVIGNSGGNTVRISAARLAAILSTLQGPSYGTIAQLRADLSWPAGAIGSVFGGSEAGVYRKSGNAGAGSWTKIGDLPVSALTAAQLAEKADLSMVSALAADLGSGRVWVLPTMAGTPSGDTIPAGVQVVLSFAGDALKVWRRGASAPADGKETKSVQKDANGNWWYLKLDAADMDKAISGLADEVRNGRVYVLPTGTPTGKTLPAGTDGVLTGTDGGTQFWVPTSQPKAGTAESETLQRDAADQWWARALDSREIATERSQRIAADSEEKQARIDAVTAETAARADADEALRLMIASPDNRIPGGTFVGGDPWMRSPAEIVGLIQPEVSGLLYPRGIRWGATNNFAIWRSLAAGVLGKYVFAGLFIVSSNPDNMTTSATVYQEDVNGRLTGLTNPVVGYVDVAPGVRFVWRTGRALASGTRNMLVGLAEAPADNQRFATGFYCLVGDTPFDADKMVAALRADQKRLAALAGLTAKAVPGVARFVYQGSGDVESFVTGSLDGSSVTRVFCVDPPRDSVRPVFNFRRDEIDGVVVRLVTDDVAPQRVWGTTLGANHGWSATTLTAAGHGKTVACQGAIYAAGGKQWMLMKIIDANTLLVTQVGANGAAPTGAYTYVSGPGPTASVTATAAVVGQFYPSIQKRTVRAIVDGSPVSYGDHPYRDRVQLRETYEVATKANLLAWWGAKGDTASPDPDATPSYVVTNTYVFDREGQCTVHTEVTALADVQIDDLAILQAQRAGATDYYIPKAVPFLLGGRSLDYATIEAADLTTTGGLPSVMMTPSRMEADGLGVDRMVALFGQSYVFACGFAPVLAAAPAQRRSNTSVKALEIRGGTDKLYMAGIDRGSFTAARGDSFAFVGYRNVARRSGIKTAAYTVRVGQDAYVYADWHDVQLTDRIDIPAELIGRPFTVVEARNVAILSGSASGAVLVDVSAAGSYAFAVLKF